MAASNVAIISCCIAFFGLLVTVISKLMNMSVKYGELVKQMDMVHNAARNDYKENKEDIAHIDSRVTILEREQNTTAIVVARLDESMQTIVQQNSKLEAKLDKICDNLITK